MMQEPNQTLRTALDLAKLGFHILPVQSGKKTPAVKGEPDGPKWGATNDPDLLTVLFGRGELNLGIACGPSSLVVLDLDVKNDADGIAWLDGQVARHGELPNTIEARTPSGGRHVYFAAPDFPVGNSAGKIAPGVDIRADGGYVVAPPSVFYTDDWDSLKYQWKNPPGFFEPAPLPDWLADLLRPPLPLSQLAAPSRIDVGNSISFADEKAPPAEVEDILGYINPDTGYQEWCTTLMGLHAHFNGSGQGLSIADKWSARSAKNKKGEVAAKWKGFSPGGGVSFGTVCELARSGGADLSAITRKHRGGVSQPERKGPNAGHTVDSKDDAKPMPEPEARFLQSENLPAPELPLEDFLAPALARWVRQAADAKGAPPDYVVASVLSVSGSAIGNARWVSPWQGWSEPPIIWAACIGLPSSNKSPGIDAVLQPYRRAEAPLREEALKKLDDWEARSELAKIATATWQEDVKKALKAGKPIPDKPEAASADSRPHIPRLVVNDGTIEKLGAIVAAQPCGTLQMRDELAGWLEGMNRYSGGGDRPFWLEAYGGRGFTVERMGRDPLTIDRLSIGVIGGIQPDRLNGLLMKSDDDGLLARIMPFWPNPAPIKRPGAWTNESMLDEVLSRLLSLDLVTNEADELLPCFIHFDDDARNLMDKWRLRVREWENSSEGLLLSFIGKLPGLAARLSLILAFLDWASGEGDEPREITVDAFGRAAHFIEDYALPMARRAYANASVPKVERAAHRIIALIRENGWASFSSRDVMRPQRSGINLAADVNAALKLLEEADCIFAEQIEVGPKGGRPPRTFIVNPKILGVPQ